MTCNIAINGFFGRMGQSIFEESKNHQNTIITIGCDVKDKIEQSNFGNVILTSNIDQHAEQFDVLIDFTLPQPSLNLINKCVSMKKPITIGTTGFTAEQMQQVVSASEFIPILLAPNMSRGVNASLDGLARISKSLKGYDILIREIHHVNKVDAPSGTALKMAQVICDNQSIELGDIESKDCPIKFTSLRENTEIGTHEVVFSGSSDEIRLLHIANNRSIFAKGAIETAVWVKEQKPGLYTYKEYMESSK